DAHSLLRVEPRPALLSILCARDHMVDIFGARECYFSLWLSERWVENRLGVTRSTWVLRSVDIMVDCLHWDLPPCKWYTGKPSEIPNTINGQLCAATLFTPGARSLAASYHLESGCTPFTRS